METGEVIITQLEKNIWTDSLNQFNITNIKIQVHTEMINRLNNYLEKAYHINQRGSHSYKENIDFN